MRTTQRRVCATTCLTAMGTRTLVVWIVFCAICWAEPAPAVLPVESVTLHRNSTAWVRRAGKVEVRQGVAVIAVDPTAEPSTWSVDVVGSPGRPIAIETDLFGPLGTRSWEEWITSHQGESFEFALPDGPAIGTVMVLPQRRRSPVDLIGIETEAGVRLLAPAEILGIRCLKAPQAMLHFKPDVQLVAVQTSALVAGLGWQPEYRLIIGPDGRARFMLTAAAENRLAQAMDCKFVEFAIAVPSRPGGIDALRLPLDDQDDKPLAPSRSRAGLRSENDPTVFAVGPQRLAERRTRHFVLVDSLATAVERFEWQVAGPPGQLLGVPAEDRVQEFIELSNPAGQSLPAGPMVVTRGNRLVARTRFPYTLASRQGRIPIGEAAAIDVVREETELERKQAAVRRENESYDWVQMAGTLTIHNRRLGPIKMRVVKAFEGEATAGSDDAKIHRRPNQLGRFNPVCEIEWDIDIQPGATRRLTYGYMLHLSPSQ